MEATLIHLGATPWPGEGHRSVPGSKSVHRGGPGPGTASVASYRPGTSLLVAFQPVTPFHCSWSRASPSSSDTGSGARPPRPPRCSAACQGDSPGAAAERLLLLLLILEPPVGRPQVLPSLSIAVARRAGAF